eukprot:02596.XXX_33393_32974_1 [CDS] Oithona nana genome sequencing.
MKFPKALLILAFIVAIYFDSVNGHCSSVDCGKCRSQFGSIDCNLAKFCGTRAGRMNPQCIKNCSNLKNCYQECLTGKKTCSKCCN